MQIYSKYKANAKAEYLSVVSIPGQTSSVSLQLVTFIVHKEGQLRKSSSTSILLQGKTPEKHL
jgi:hypothetical protein